MAKTILLGCSNVTTPPIDIQLIGVENKEYDESNAGQTIIRDSLTVSNTEVSCSVPATIAVQPLSITTTTTIVTSDPNTVVYFCDTSLNNITLTVYSTSKHIVVIKTSELNTLTVVPDTGDIDGTSSINIIYLSPKDIYFDGTNFWSK